MHLTAAREGAALAVDLVNSWDEFVDPPEVMRDAGWLRRWLRAHDFERAAAAVRDDDLERGRELRARIAQVFDATTEEDAVVLLNGLVDAHGIRPRLERVSDAWRFRSWPDEEAGLGFAAAYCALGLLEAIRELGWERFGRCDAAPCRCVYIDRTRNRRRRYCCSLCADRVAQAQYRRRRGRRG